MRYTTLGSSGLRVSTVALGGHGLGTRLDSAASTAVVRSAVDAGITLFDTADVYDDGLGEETLGRALAGVRDQVVLATKGRWATGSGANERGSSRIHLRAAVEASLRRLGTDRIDLYQLHAPDPSTPIEETVSALDQLVTAGKILYAGTSNFAGWQVVDAHWAARRHDHLQLVATQAPYSLLQRDAERELLPAARRCGVGFIACVALARGLLAGAYGHTTDAATLSHRRRGFLTDRNRARMAVVTAFAAQRGLTTAEVALAALLGHADVHAVIVGAGDEEQVRANAAATSVRLPETDRHELLATLRRLDDDTSG